jgi:hypothetical protein
MTTSAGYATASVRSGALFGVLVDGPEIDQRAIIREHSISVRVQLGISKSEQVFAYSFGLLEVEATANDPIHHNGVIMVQTENFNCERLLVDH